MVFLELDNVRLNSNYNINLTISKDDFIAFFGRSPELNSKVLQLISGIIPNFNITFNNEMVYNNEDYFKRRIYFDFNDRFIKTIHYPVIAETMKVRYQLDIDETTFKCLVDLLQIRNEWDCKGKKEFTDQGNTLINYTLVNSLSYEAYILNNPTINLNNDKKEKVIDGLLKLKENGPLLLGLNSINDFKGKLDKLVIFTDFNRTLRVLPNNLKVSVIYGDARMIYQYINEEERLFYSFSDDVFKLTFIDILSKDTKKDLISAGCKIKNISIYDIELYM